jgi:hypothetical protein
MAIRYLKKREIHVSSALAHSTLNGRHLFRISTAIGNEMDRYKYKCRERTIKSIASELTYTRKQTRPRRLPISRMVL